MDGVIRVNLVNVVTIGLIAVAATMAAHFALNMWGGKSGAQAANS